ncbi:MAG: hypothetical protein ACE141_18815 [Bryobacteraceae bacterium]
MRLVMMVLIGLACQAQTYEFHQRDTARCKVIWRDGVPYAELRGDRATVTIDARQLMKERTVGVIVENRGQEEIEIRPETFTLEYTEKGKKGAKTTKWLPWEEVYRRVEKDSRWSAVFASIGAGLASVQRPVAGATTTHQGTITTDRGSSGTYSGTSRTAVWAPDYEARAESAERARRAGETARDWAKWLDRASLKRHTLGPGETVAGLVFFENPKKGAWFRLTVPVRGETFRFSWEP